MKRSTGNYSFVCKWKEKKMFSVLLTKYSSTSEILTTDDESGQKEKPQHGDWVLDITVAFHSFYTLGIPHHQDNRDKGSHSCKGVWWEDAQVTPQGKHRVALFLGCFLKFCLRSKSIEWHWIVYLLRVGWTLGLLTTSPQVKASALDLKKGLTVFAFESLFDSV